MLRDLIEGWLDEVAPERPNHPVVVRAIALLDRIDGDCDMEPEPCEPSGEEDERYPSWTKKHMLGN